MKNSLLIARVILYINSQKKKENKQCKLLAVMVTVWQSFPVVRNANTIIYGCWPAILLNTAAWINAWKILTVQMYIMEIYSAVLFVLHEP